MLTARKNCSMKGKLEAGSLTVESGAAIQGEIRVAVDGASSASDSLHDAPQP